MKQKIAALLILSLVTVGFTACGKEADKDNSTRSGSEVESGSNTAGSGELSYDFGENVTFHSDEPVVYSMMYSDHENYPLKEDWLLWKAIEEKTNVTFDLTSVARTDYEDKLKAVVNTGAAPYIIPKVYDSLPYEAGGQVVAISDWTQYMPNYMKCVNDWDMDEDLSQIKRDNGKYYRLPGMWEQSNGGGYSLLIRKDIFEAAGVDITELEKNWTWDDFHDACVKVKEHTGAKYVWSDQFQLDGALSISGAMYNVKGGWTIGDGMLFDHDKKEFYFSDTTDEYGELMKMWSKLYSQEILDPESFTQDNEQAQAKFYRGDSFVLTCNYQQLADIQSGNKMADANADLYYALTPTGPAGKVTCDSQRLENGIMISQKALDELGEEEFIKMLRFIDWLWYSEEGQTLVQWGVEGETYTKDTEGNIKLNEDIYWSGFNPGAEKQLNVDYGFGGGVFAYGGSRELQFSKMPEGQQEYVTRMFENRETKPIDPPILSNEEEREELNLINVPLIDYVKTSTLEFINGSKDAEKDFEDYKKQCEAKGSIDYQNSVNEIFERTKGALGY